MKKREQRRIFERDYKVEAIKLSDEHGVAQAAKTLGIHPTLLSKWKKSFAAEGVEAFRGNGNRTALEEENRRLRIELKRSQEEVDILKKASAYFAVASHVNGSSFAPPNPT